MNYEEALTSYLLAIDESLDILSEREEGKLSGLPSWALHKREIVIGVTEDDEGIAIKVTPDDRLTEDKIVLIKIVTTNDMEEIISPMKWSGALPNKGPENDFSYFSDMSVVEAANPIAVPVLENRFLMGWGRKAGFYTLFTAENAKEDAINYWNVAQNNLGKDKNFVQETRKVFDTIQAIIKRKTFLERRVHRFIYEHRNILLPNHKRCLYEHKLYLDNEMRVSDFILEREQGLPPIFIELESPVHEVFTKNLDLRAQVNHARQQISEWVQFITEDPQRNASGEYRFMTGPIERLIVIGKGLADREQLNSTKYDGITIWTYSIFIEEARNVSIR